MTNPQLTFESLRLNPTVNPILYSENKIQVRLKHQAQVIYKALKAGPVWTAQLRAIAAQYNARIKELRECLQEFDMTIDCTFRSSDGNNRYELRPFHGSRYQAELITKQSKKRKEWTND